MEKGTYLSFDILPMFSGGSMTPKYSCSITLKSGEVIDIPQLTRNQLIKNFHKYKPYYIGTDNPSEILRPGQTLGSFCGQINEHGTFVHVNLTKSGKTVPLTQLLQHHNYSIKGKLNPLETAKAMNFLMDIGIGMALEPFENETILHIGKPKRHKKGGWSQARYSRQMEEVVHHATQNTISVLKEQNIDFDLQTNKTKFGAHWSRFYLFDKKSDLIKLIKKISFHPCKIKIWSPKRDIVSHSPIRNSPEIQIEPAKTNDLIIGIDPGIETGVGILNLQGNIIHTFSKKNSTRADLIREISDIGSPIIVCTDVSPIPHLVKKIAALYGAELFHPKKLLSQIDKKKIIAEHNISTKYNSHIRDALSAAIFAFNGFNSKFKQIDEKDEMNSYIKRTAKKMVIRGFSLADSIFHAETTFDKIKTDQNRVQLPTIPFEEKVMENLPLKNRIKNLEQELTLYIAEVSRLRDGLKQLEEKNSQLIMRKNKQQLNLIRKELENEIISDKERLISNLTNSLDILNRNLTQEREKSRNLENMIWKNMETNGYPVRVIKIFSINEITRIDIQNNSNGGDLLLIEDPTGGGLNTAKLLNEMNIKMIFFENNNFSPIVQNFLYDHKIPHIRAEKYDIMKLDNIASINKNNLELAITDYNGIFEDEQKKRDAEKIDKTIENFYYERQKEIEDSDINYDDYVPEGEFDVDDK